MAISARGTIGPRAAASTPTASAALVPWPATVAARTALKAGINAPNLSDDRADALGMTAAEIVERYASTAPTPIKNEAMPSGWPAGCISAPRGTLSRPAVGGITFSWRPTIGRNALRQSGAMGLLSLWHKPARHGA